MYVRVPNKTLRKTLITKFVVEALRKKSVRKFRSAKNSKTDILVIVLRTNNNSTTEQIKYIRRASRQTENTKRANAYFVGKITYYEYKVCAFGRPNVLLKRILEEHKTAI